MELFSNILRFLLYFSITLLTLIIVCYVGYSMWEADQKMLAEEKRMELDDI